MLSINQNTWTDIRSVTANDAVVPDTAVVDAFQAVEYVEGQIAVELGAGVTSLTLTMYVMVGSKWAVAFDKDGNIIQHVFTANKAVIVPFLKAPTALAVTGWAGAAAATTIRALAVK